MKHLNDPDAEPLFSYLEVIGDTLAGCNYVVSFDLQSFEAESEEFTPEKALLLSYPDYFAVNKAVASPSSPTKMGQRVKECFLYPLNSPNYPRQVMPYLSDAEVFERLQQYWHIIGKCIDWEGADIFECYARAGSRGALFFTFWGFLFVIHNKQQRRCAVLFGSASD